MHKYEQYNEHVRNLKGKFAYYAPFMHAATLWLCNGYNFDNISNKTLIK